MDAGSSIVEFFYNLIPGVLFVFAVEFMYTGNLFPMLSSRENSNVDLLVILFYVVIGLFLGFIFQALTKLIRECTPLNHFVANEVREKNIDIFNDVYKEVMNQKYDETKQKTIIQAIYRMDNDLSGDHAAFLRTYTSSRFAFWSNIFFALFVLLIIWLFKSNIDGRVFLGFITSLVFSGTLGYKYLFAYMDSILKSYYMKKK